MRDTLETRRSKVQARLEHVSSMKMVVTDLQDTHISPPPTANDIHDVTMDDVASLPSPTSPTLRHSFADGMGLAGSAANSSPNTLFTKAKILASPIVPVSPRISYDSLISNANHAQFSTLSNDSCWLLYKRLFQLKNTSIHLVSKTLFHP